jgi:hypothetical protein
LSVTSKGFSAESKNAAAAQVANDRQALQRDEAAAARARAAASEAQSTASAAHTLATQLNQAASQLRSQWEQASQAAQQAHARADQAQASYNAAEKAAQAAQQAIGPVPKKPAASASPVLANSPFITDIKGGSSGQTSVGMSPCMNFGLACAQSVTITHGQTSTASTSRTSTSSAPSAAAEAQYQSEVTAYNERVNTYDKDQANASRAWVAWQTAKAHAQQLQQVASQLWSRYSAAKDKATAAADRAKTDSELAAQARALANSLTTVAEGAQVTLDDAEAAYIALLAQYDQEHHEGQPAKAKPGKKKGTGNPGGGSGPPVPPGRRLPPGAQQACRKSLDTVVNALKDAASARNGRRHLRRGQLHRIDQGTTRLGCRHPD